LSDGGNKSRRLIWDSGVAGWRFIPLGNASGISGERGLVVIKPSSVAYERLKPAHFTLIHSNGKMVQASSDHRPTCPPIASSTTPLLRSAWEPTGIPYMPPPGGAGAQAHSGFRLNACHDFHRPVAEFTATRLASFPSVDDRWPVQVARSFLVISTYCFRFEPARHR
jgi:hypothetical protein